MRVFPDASIWLAALGRPEGGSGKIFQFCEAGEAIPLVTVGVFAEVRRNLAKMKRTPADLESLVMRVRPVLLDLTPEALAKWAVMVEEKDRHIIAGAVEGKADFLATFDRQHLATSEVRQMVSFLIGNAGACLEWLRTHGPQDRD